MANVKPKLDTESLEVDSAVVERLEDVGTIMIDEHEQDPRKKLRPQPSLDPNDPLVSINSD